MMGGKREAGRRPVEGSIIIKKRRLGRLEFLGCNSELRRAVIRQHQPKLRLLSSMAVQLRLGISFPCCWERKKATSTLFIYFAFNIIMPQILVASQTGFWICQTKSGKKMTSLGQITHSSSSVIRSANVTPDGFQMQKRADAAGIWSH